MKIEGVRFMGVDLAWSSTGRGRTGLCASDAGGTILDSTSVRTDDEILEWLEVHCRGPVVVGFDAPITVPNARGRRRCDAVISRVFGPQEAGVYPANRSNPAFADGTRAEHLAHRLGLSLDPRIDAGDPTARVALETYPHSAIVALFGLQVTLKYKRGRGRDVARRQRALDRLLDLLESLARAEPPFDPTTAPRWSAIRSAADTAERHADLDRIEDEADAYVCAYVAAHFWTHGDGDRCRLIGDAAGGHIVTPVAARHRRALDAAPGP